MANIHLAATDQQIEACRPVMTQLRPHIAPDDFLARIRRQQGQGYQLAYLDHDDQVLAVAGFRILENLAWGKFLYVDDLVADSASRSSGHGGQLLLWLLNHARQHDCDQFHLDSGVHRFAAHRFYLTHRLDIIAHHFAVNLRQA